MDSHDSYEQYSDVCAQIAALYEESTAVNVVLCGDFNCHTGSRLHDLYLQLCTDLNVIESDVNRLPVTSFTYCNDNGTVTSWIDHFLCSRAIDVLTVDVNILYHYMTSDHKPLLMSLGNIDISGNVLSSHNVNVDACFGNTVIDWKNCDEYDLFCYRCALDDELRKINIPVNLLRLESEYDNVSDGVKQSVDTYYNAIMASIRTASATVLPSKKVTSHYEQYITPGWNDLVSDKHAAARAAFIEWNFSGKHRNCPE